MQSLIDKIMNTLMQLHLLPEGSVVSFLKFLLIVSDIIAFLLLIIFIFVLLFLRNKLLKILSAVLVTSLSLFLLVQIALYIDMVYIEPNWIKVEQVNLKIPSLGNVLRGAKIVQFSDLHVDKLGFKEKKLIKIVNSLNPEIIFITGDFINSKEGLEPCLSILRQMKSKRGIYAILGNIDYIFFNEKEIASALNKVGIIILLRDNVKLDFGKGRNLRLVGISSERDSGPSDSDISTALMKVPLNEAKIMLVHIPDTADRKILLDYKPQLILAGHTHGGQFGIPFIRKYSDYAERSKYMAGLFYVNGIPLYVNRGIGTKTRNIRFMCRPEVTVFNITD